MTREDATIRLLLAARTAAREQAQFYRSLAGRAEAAEDATLSERLQELHADEQHHLSRLSARLLELEAVTPAAQPGSVEVPGLEDWEPTARERESAEVRRYESLLEQPIDETTRRLIEQILEVERHHLRELAGKWTPA